jgi:hypothetical protein
MEDLKAAAEGDIFTLGASIGKKCAGAAQAFKPSGKEGPTQALKVPEIELPTQKQEQHEAPAPTRSPRPGRRR